MRSPADYVTEIERIVGDPVRGDGKIEASFSTETAAEARDLIKRLALMQRELRLVKKEVRMEIRDVKSAFVSQRSNVQAGFWASALGGRGGAARDRKNKREEAKAKEGSAVAGHEGVDRMIDQLLFQIDQAKHNAERFVRENTPVREKAAPTATRRQDPAELLRALKKMQDEGLIDDVEFQTKRAEILARI